MSSGTPGVKARSYDARRRRARAEQRRATTVDVARRLFLDRGYTSATVESIADAAGVSPATIYKSYGGKAGLARAVCEDALTGRGGLPAEERSNELRHARDVRELAAGWGRLAAEVSPRISPLMLVLRSASEHDAEAASLYEELDRARLRRMSDNARHLADGGHLPGVITPQEARDVLWLCTSPELYDLLVVRRRWSAERFGGFVAEVIAGTLLVGQSSYR